MEKEICLNHRDVDFVLVVECAWGAQGHEVESVGNGVMVGRDVDYELEPVELVSARIDAEDGPAVDIDSELGEELWDALKDKVDAGDLEVA